MSKMKAAMIGFLPEGQNPYETLETYARMGYRAFEGGNLLLKGDPAENLKRVEAMGMEPLAVHYNVGEPQDIRELIKCAKAIGVRRAACYNACAAAYRFSQRGDMPGYDELMRECEQFDLAAEELGKEGITLSFHNHDAEFLLRINGVPVIYLMAANTWHLKFEVDCGWAAYAGFDPSGFMEGLGSRMAAVHIKDYIAGSRLRIEEPDGRITYKPQFTTPGTGALNLKGCLETAQALGMDYAIVEQDYQYHLTEAETLRAAYLNMKETGFVE